VGQGCRFLARIKFAWNKFAQNNRLSEFQEAESGIGSGRHLKKWGNRPKGIPESRVIYGLEIPRGYNMKKEDCFMGRPELIA
jgi:hypothetical protein